MRHPGTRDSVPAARILRRGARSGRLMHVEEIAARPGEGVPWPDWVPEEITLAFARAGVARPWAHQAATRALAADQVRAIQARGIAGVIAAVVDGDTQAAERERARTRANYRLTTPDMLHHVLLPRHSRWGD